MFNTYLRSPSVTTVYGLTVRDKGQKIMWFIPSVCFFLECHHFLGFSLRWQGPFLRPGPTERMPCWGSTKNWWRSHLEPQKQNCEAWRDPLCSSARKLSLIKCHPYVISLSLSFTQSCSLTLTASDFLPPSHFCFSGSLSRSNFSHDLVVSVLFQMEDRTAPSAVLIVLSAQRVSCSV